MTGKQLEKVVASLPARQKNVYEAIREHGPISGPKLKAFVDEANAGYTGRLRELADKGVVRHPVKPSTHPVHEASIWRATSENSAVVDEVLVWATTMKGFWEVTPAADVEAEREKAAKRKRRVKDVSELPLDERVQWKLYLDTDPEVEQAIKDPVHAERKKERDRLRRESRSRAAKLRQIEGLGLGAYTDWHERKRSLYWAVQLIVDIDESAFWQVAEEEKLEEALSDLLLAKAAVDHAVESLQRGEMPAALRSKVEKLIALAESTPFEEEASTAREHAERLAAGREVMPAPIRLGTDEEADPWGMRTW